MLHFLLCIHDVFLYIQMSNWCFLNFSKHTQTLLFVAFFEFCQHFFEFGLCDKRCHVPGYEGRCCQIFFGVTPKHCSFIFEAMEKTIKKEWKQWNDSNDRFYVLSVFELHWYSPNNSNFATSIFALFPWIEKLFDSSFIFLPFSWKSIFFGHFTKNTEHAFVHFNNRRQKWFTWYHINTIEIVGRLPALFFQIIFDLFSYLFIYLQWK